VVYKTEGIVLRTRSLGEADTLVTLYTKEHGKVRAAARGARRPRNRLMGPAQVFTHGRYILFKGKQLDTLSQGDIIHSYQAFREDLDWMASAMYAAEVMDVLIEEGEPNPDLFYLLSNTFQLGKQGRFRFALRVFELRLMQFLGYEPQMEACISCHSPLESQIYFTVEGGAVCPACRSQFRGVRPLSPNGWQWMKRLLHWDYARVNILHPSDNALEELSQLMQSYISYRLERPLKSLDFLSTVQKPAPPSRGKEKNSTSPTSPVD